jgi:hypothetical protein
MVMKTPTLKAMFTPAGFLTLWCEHCLLFHNHGKVPGHLAAHCVETDSPYLKTGYVLKPVQKRPSAWPPKALNPWKRKSLLRQRRLAVA